MIARVVWIALLLSLFAAGALLQASLPLNHDVSWLLVASERLLAGADVFGRDVVEHNPPMILYVLAPAVAIAEGLGVSLIATLRVYVALCIAGSLGLSARLLGSWLGTRDRGAIGTFVVVYCFALWIPSHTHFAQREHFLVMGLVPYAIAAAARVSGVSLAPSLRVAAGIVGAIGICVKPHYVLALAGIELLVFARARDVRVWLRAESVVMVSIGLLYVIGVVTIFPNYFELVVPLALDTYWVFQRPIASIIGWPHLALMALSGLAVWLAPGERRGLAAVFCVAAFAAYGARLLQSTGWPYLLLPFETFSLLTIACAITPWVSGSRWSDARSATAVLALCIALFELLPGGVRLTWSLGADWRAGRTPGVIGELSEFIDSRAPGGRVYFFSAGLLWAFPTIHYTNATWSSRFPCLWALAAIRSPRVDGRGPSPERRQELYRYLVDAVVEDLERGAPDLIFVDVAKRKPYLGRNFDYLEFFGRDVRFQQQLSLYEPTVKVDRYQVYERR